MRLLLIILCLISLSGISIAAPPEWLYVTSFQTGYLYIIDPDTGRLIRSLPTADRAGSAGFAVSADGRLLLVVDDHAPARVRGIDALSGESLFSVPFRDRQLLLGGAPEVHATRDGRWLLIATHDYAADADGVRVFNRKEERFRPVGLRGRGCPMPRLASFHDGTLIEACPGSLRELRPSPTTDVLTPVGSVVPTPLDTVSQLLVSDDDRYVLAVGPHQPGRPWPLVSWRRGAASAQVRDLGALPDLPSARTPAMATTSEGAVIGLVLGDRAWFLDRADLRLVRGVRLEAPAQGAVFARGRQALWTVAVDRQGGAVLLSIPARDGSVRRHPLSARLAATQVQLLSAPRPPVSAR